MNLLVVKDVVEKLLREQPETRDNDNLLILKVWAEQNPKLREGDSSFWGFAKDFIDGKYAPAESIRRSRQKLQELNVELQGKSYKKRQKEQDKVKEDLHKF